MTVMNQTTMAMPVSPSVSSTGAPARAADAWHDMDWRQVNRHVPRLQTRIVKAAQAGRWGKVKALQRLLTHSFSGRALAVRRVTENQGKRTPGVGCCYIPTVISRCTVVVYPWKSRVLEHRALARLERYAGKLARTVLRGGGGGNVASLPDQPTRLR